MLQGWRNYPSIYKQEKQISIILTELTQIETKYTDKQIGKILSHIKSELNGLV